MINIEITKTFKDGSIISEVKTFNNDLDSIKYLTELKKEQNHCLSKKEDWYYYYRPLLKKYNPPYEYIKENRKREYQLSKEVLNSPFKLKINITHI